MRMRPEAALALFLSLAVAPTAAQAEWKPVEKIATYRVSGRTGIDLYRSIGHRGPIVGTSVRAIAHTNFRLTWKRDYQRRGSACVLASAFPKLVITYTLPEAAEKLDPALAARWKTFREGIAAHERVHGEQIIAMARKIEAATVGFTLENDPDCKKIYPAMQERLGALSREQQEASNAFDRTEMAPGGTIEKLVLDLVNGG